MKIKICGLTNTREVEYLKKNNVDFAGIVLFFEKSKRNVTIEKAKEIIKVIKSQQSYVNKTGDAEIPSVNCKVVAVTVAPTAEQVKQIELAGFDFLQIHGSVSDELISECEIPVLKAFNVDDLNKYEHYLTFDNIKGFVFDAGEPGSGKTFDWDMLKKLKRDEDRLYILAGGLDASNVKRAIDTVSPDGVDVSSSVEYTDKLGKDPEKIDEFVKSVRMA